MSKALRETKCFSRSTRCAAQMRPPVQRRTASSLPDCRSSRTAWMADRADMRELIRLGIARALLRHQAQDLRDHVAGALHDHRVALAHILARDLVLIVQRRIGDDDAADRHRLQPRHRRQRACAAHLDVDLLQHRRRPSRRRTCARCPSAGSARRSPAAAASPAGSPCRRRHRCHSPARRAGFRSAGNAPAALPPSGKASSADWSEIPRRAKASITPICVSAGSSGASPQA